MKWCKHAVVEANLRQLGIKFDVETNIPMSEIDLKKGWTKQVRHRKLEDEATQNIVIRYGMKMQEDTAWNMTILQKEGNKKYFPYSGNQRLAAFEFASVGTHIDAYVVQLTDPVMMDLLPRVVNTWEAVEGMSKDEAVQNAQYMHEFHRVPVAEAAKMFGLKTELVYRSNRIRDSKNKLQNFGIPVRGISDYTLDQLGRIKNTNSLKRSASLIHKFSIKGDDAKQFINDVREGSTESQQGAIIERWEDALTRRSQKASSSVKLPHAEYNRERLLKLMTSLSRFCERNRTRSQMQMNDPIHIQTLKKCWAVAAPVITNVINGGEE